uniref:Uncharacterized protein n=1 Tax=Ixodes ricinus TaxID=34613 RepID=A0A6B0UME1_IXORI
MALVYPVWGKGEMLLLAAQVPWLELLGAGARVTIREEDQGLNKGWLTVTCAVGGRATAGVVVVAGGDNRTHSWHFLRCTGVLQIWFSSLPFNWHGPQIWRDYFIVFYLLCRGLVLIV